MSPLDKKRTGKSLVHPLTIKETQKQQKKEGAC
jgi:hypothetical protein